MSQELTLEEWLAMMQKQGYYFQQIAKEISQLSISTCRKVNQLIQKDHPATHEECLKEFKEVPEMARTCLLLEKATKHACCAGHLLSGIVAAFLIEKLNSEAPNSTLH